MKKEIKLRAWDKELKTFIYFDTTKRFINHGFWKSVQKYKMPINEFVGLKDKNGNNKCIYEGDIYDIYESENSHSTNAGLLLYPNCEVVLSVGCFCFMVPAEGMNPRVPIPIYMECNRTFKYKGNIYENPELLKQEDGK